MPSSAVKGQAQNTLPDKDGGQATAELRTAPAAATAAVERATQAPRRRLLLALADAEAGKRETKGAQPWPPMPFRGCKVSLPRTHTSIQVFEAKRLLTDRRNKVPQQ